MVKTKVPGKNIFFINFILFSIMLALSCIFLYLVFQNYIHTENRPSETIQRCINEKNIVSVIIDAGHGGKDGGAVGINGAYEKDLNLAISFILSDMLTASGINTVMTRTEDQMLYTDAPKGHRKAQDLKNRYLISEKYPDAAFISIHMNKFAESKYSGLQVYYSANNESSRVLASKLQEFTKSYLQPQNDRKIKVSGTNIYLLDRIKSPAVLVECGFLSNETEANLLADKTYQKKLACVLYTAITDYLNSAESTVSKK